jgi:hypothetical protein
VKEARQSRLLPIDLVVLANLISEKVWEIHMRRSEIASRGRESNFRTCGKTQIASNLCSSGNEDIGLHASSYPGRCDSQNRILKAVIHSNRPIAAGRSASYSLEDCLCLSVHLSDSHWLWRERSAHGLLFCHGSGGVEEVA